MKGKRDGAPAKKKKGVFGWLQADTVAAVWTAAAAIHREKNTVEAAAAAGLQPQQAAANKPKVRYITLKKYSWTHVSEPRVVSSSGSRVRALARLSRCTSGGMTTGFNACPYCYKSCRFQTGAGLGVFFAACGAGGLAGSDHRPFLIPSLEPSRQKKIAGEAIPPSKKDLK
jgi:hypothetical protein